MTQAVRVHGSRAMKTENDETIKAQTMNYELPNNETMKVQTINYERSNNKSIKAQTMNYKL